MNIFEMDILKNLGIHPFITQRELAEQTGFSLGIINRSLHNLMDDGYLDRNKSLTEMAKAELKAKSPQRAIILAAGYGLRMIPINLERPKGLIRIGGEALIERLISQLHEVGIRDIDVIVGFMQEEFEYLIDSYGVRLISNEKYAVTNNLHSLNLVREKISNCYIVPSDIWCEHNPFRKTECYSWYMVKDSVPEINKVRVNRKKELIATKPDEVGNTTVGIAYITEEDAVKIRQRVAYLDSRPENQQMHWERALFEKDRMLCYANVVPESEITEINTYEQLREFDSGSSHLQHAAISAICEALSVEPSEITEITTLKKGMTNRSFLFSCRGKKYIMRIPGIGTDQLIDRQEEAAVYDVIKDKKICDDLVYINPETGYKITKFLNNVRSCDPHSEQDLQKCMSLLKAFHNLKLKVPHEFKIFEKIEFYETLWLSKTSLYRDYERTKENVFKLKYYIDSHVGEKSLTHIDAVADNFLFYPMENGKEGLRLIDWEYAAMQDPHVDIAMFCIYALYDKQQTDHLIDIYFENKCPLETRVKIYCYVAACGLLWSNWCEYKRQLGVEFGEYNLRQYRYAKDFYQYAIEGMGKIR